MNPMKALSGTRKAMIDEAAAGDVIALSGRKRPLCALGQWQKTCGGERGGGMRRGMVGGRGSGNVGEKRCVHGIPRKNLDENIIRQKKGKVKAWGATSNLVRGHF